MSVPNVTVINFKSGGLNPLKVHSDVQDPMARGFFEVADTTNGSRAQYGTLGNLAANALSAPGSRFGSFTEADLKAALKQEGFASLSRKLSDHQQRLLAELDGIRVWNLGNPDRMRNLNRLAVGTEFAKWGINLAGLLGPGGIPVFAAKGLFIIAKDGLSKFIGSTFPQPAMSVAKSALAGFTWQGDFVPWKSALQGTQEFAVAQREGLAVQQDAVLRRVASIAAELRELRMARQQLAELTVLEMVTNRTVTDLSRQPASAAASQLTGLTFSSSQPWSQMPDLMKEATSKAPAGKPVLLVSQDPIKSFAFEHMLNHRGMSVFAAPPLKQEELERLSSVLSPGALIGFQRDLEDTRRKLFLRPAESKYFPPPDKGGGTGTALTAGIPVIKQGSGFVFPGVDGRSVTLPLPPNFNTPASSWNSFKPWTPKGDVGGVRTQDLEWVFVDKGEWPVMTLFTLAYESAAARGGVRQ